MAAPTDVEALARQVKDARERTVQAAPKYAQDYDRYEQAQAGDRERLDAELAVFETLVGGRLEGALQLLHAPEIAQQFDPTASGRDATAKLLPVLRQLNDQLGSVTDLALGSSRLVALFEQLSQDNSNQATIQMLQDQLGRSRSLIVNIRAALDSFAYPYDHAKGQISLGEFALSELPDGDNPGQIYEASGSLIESTSRLRARLAGHLCLVAERVESALGLEPLPEPAEEDAESPSRA
jgi:hypothetical protein